VRSQLEAQKTSWDELRKELDDSEETCGELRGKLADREEKLAAALAENKKSATASKD
jgi:septal ring factor EnvC (AmiA/AmiB activator)